MGPAKHRTGPERTARVLTVPWNSYIKYDKIFGHLSNIFPRFLENFVKYFQIQVKNFKQFRIFFVTFSKKFRNFSKKNISFKNSLYEVIPRFLDYWSLKCL